MQSKVHRISQVTANKDHECSYSGRKITNGELYYTVVYKLGGEFLTYKVCADDFDEFCKNKLFIELDNDYEKLKEEAEKLNYKLMSLREQFKHIPEVAEKLQNLVKV